jgi:hypothetical protein
MPTAIGKMGNLKLLQHRLDPRVPFRSADTPQSEA